MRISSIQRRRGRAAGEGADRRVLVRGGEALVVERNRVEEP